MTAQNTSRLIARLGRSLFVAFFALVVGMTFHPQVLLAATAPEAPSAPAVLTPVAESVEGELRPLFTGLVTHGNQVEVHVDGQFHGLARVADGGTVTDSFAARPALDLKPGHHIVVFRSKDPNTGLRSNATEPRSFWVRLQVAPAVVETVVDRRTTPEQPFVVGFSTNESTVTVYVNGKADGKVKVGSDDSNAAHFAYKVSRKLSVGTHTLTASATSPDGRQSVVSAGINYTVPAPTPVAEVDTERDQPSQQPTPKPTTDTSSTDDDSTSSSDDADSDDTATPSVSGEEVKGEVFVNTNTSPETTDEESDATDETTDEESNTNAAVATDEEETNNTALVTWIIVIVVLVIILALRLRSGRVGEEEGTKTLFADDKQGTDKGGENNKNKNSDRGSSPPPPPPSSSY